MFEWFHPMFIDDSKYNTTVYVDQVSFPQLIEIVSLYKPEIIWSDGDWGKSDDYWRSKEFLAWLYNASPVKDTVVVNDRWGGDTIGKHGGFLTFSDHYDPGKLLSRKWENCMTLDKFSWGNRRTIKVCI
uniref:alpha-L-fucosidase n=1 Tax=Angiostrongylus cantonensis TaxID=6313 RepID=A0A0K0D3D9_ANGCA